MSEKSTFDLNGKPCLSGQIFEPRVGVWYADIEVDEEEAPSGAAILTIYGELEFHGSIVDARTATDNGRVVLRLEGGSGRLDEKIEARSFRRTNVRNLLNAAFRSSGDVIDDTSTVLDHPIPYWSWSETFGEAIMHAIASEASAAWRTLPGGGVWIGTETWPAVSDDFEYQQGPIKQGQTVVFLENLPLVRPGTTFQGKRVAEVVTAWGEGVTFQQQIAFEDASGTPAFTRSIQTEVVDWFDRTRGQKLDLSMLYPCTVVGQSADLLTVDLRPDDSRIGTNGLQGVSLRLGVPCFRPQLKIGVSRCMVGWEAADPKRPYACIFERDGIVEWKVQTDDGAPITLNVTGADINIKSDSRVNIDAQQILLNGGGLGIARKTDLVSIGLPTSTAPGSPCAPALPGAPAQIGVIITASTGSETS